MPLVTVHTSVQLHDDGKLKKLQKDISATTARLLGKPENYVMTSVQPSARMTFAGSFEPSCLVEVKSIGALAGEVPAKFTAAVSEHLRECLGVPPSRVFVVFADVPGRFWGFDGAMLG
jgi:phenylpyruvate tautomerase PptA (4-oxalocrotonate tautomerase family)